MKQAIRQASLGRLAELLNDLDRERIGYRLRHDREESIAVDVALPGERWEIEFLVDGSIEIERFVSAGIIYDESLIPELFRRYADPDASAPRGTAGQTASLETDTA